MKKWVKYLHLGDACKLYVSDSFHIFDEKYIIPHTKDIVQCNQVFHVFSSANLHQANESNFESKCVNYENIDNKLEFSDENQMEKIPHMSICQPYPCTV